MLRDILRHALNNDPNLAASFFDSPITAKYWSKKQITFDHIRSYGFDASRKMGDIAIEINPCSNIASIRSAFQLLLNQELNCHEEINSKEFYRLYKLRNIIAHRNGVVDKQYKDETGADAEIGERLIVSPNDFSKHYLTSKKLAYALLKDISVIFKNNLEQASESLDTSG
jgi:Mg2+ and Co2+ transporter CorA